MVAAATEAFRSRPALYVLDSIQPANQEAPPVAHLALVDVPSPVLALPAISQVPRYLETIFDLEREQVSYASDVGDKRKPPVAAITVFGIANPEVPLSRSPGMSSGMFTYEGSEGKATHISIIFHDVAAAVRYMERPRKTNRRRSTSHLRTINVSLGVDTIEVSHAKREGAAQTASFGEPVHMSKTLGVQVLRDDDTLQVNRLVFSPRYPDGRPTLIIRAPQRVGKELPSMIAWDQELQRRAQENSPSDDDNDQTNVQQSYEVPRGHFVDIVKRYPVSLQ